MDKFKERYNQIIDEAYENYANSHFTPPKNPNSKLLAPQLWSVIPMQHNKESFIHEIKTNPKFSKKWGVTIYTEVEGDEVYMGIVYNGNAAKIKIK